MSGHKYHQPVDKKYIADALDSLNKFYESCYSSEEMDRYWLEFTNNSYKICGNRQTYSFILMLPEHLRTVEHIYWALIISGLNYTKEAL